MRGIKRSQRPVWCEAYFASVCNWCYVRLTVTSQESRLLERVFKKVQEQIQSVDTRADDSVLATTIPSSSLSLVKSMKISAMMFCEVSHNVINPQNRPCGFYQIRAQRMRNSYTAAFVFWEPHNNNVMFFHWEGAFLFSYCLFTLLIEYGIWTSQSRQREREHTKECWVLI